MKAELAPDHSQKIGNNHVLWFKNSNSYIVVSSTTNMLLSLFWAAKDNQSFTSCLQEKIGISEQESIIYSKELSQFLIDVNKKAHSTQFKTSKITIPEPQITKYYRFGEIVVSIHYSSDKLVKLIHPHLEHTGINSETISNHVFDIFTINDHIYLYKNQVFIGCYGKRNFNFLQGKFAMELTTTLYNNNESNWLATFHASTVCDEDKAIMIIGDSGNGKSTFSALLMANGLDLLSDDFTPMLANDQNLYRFPAAISIKKNAFPLIDSLFSTFNSLETTMSTSKNIAVKYLPPSKLFESSKKNFKCHKIVLVKYSTDGATELRECSSEKILQTLIPDSWISPKSEHSKAFLNWLSQLKFYELNYSNNTIAVNKFKELFKI